MEATPMRVVHSSTSDCDAASNTHGWPTEISHLYKQPLPDARTDGTIAAATTAKASSNNNVVPCFIVVVVGGVGGVGLALVWRGGLLVMLVIVCGVCGDQKQACPCPSPHLEMRLDMLVTFDEMSGASDLFLTRFRSSQKKQKVGGSSGHTGL